MNIYDKMRERVAELCQEDDCAETPYILDSWDDTPETVRESYRKNADQILSIRLNDKGDPDPEGRYGIAVVDRGAALPDYPIAVTTELGLSAEEARFRQMQGNANYGLAQLDMLKAGFVLEIKEE